MSQSGLSGRLPGAVMGKIFSSMALAVMFLSIQAGLAQAHGAHATFISPDNRAPVSGDMLVHIKKLPMPVPYVHLTVRNVSTGSAQWSGLVPASDAGYTQSIELDGWATGSYDIEAQFVGDIVEQIQRRRVTVVVPD